jgi:8-oxo-dGTP diphosphatase
VGLRELARVLPDYVRIAWWGASERGPLEVVQGVVQHEGRVLLAVRTELQGWELPGGTVRPGEPETLALFREIREETGVDVDVEALVGEYTRTGFRPHRARVFRCRYRAGAARPSRETPRVAWFDANALPDTIFPWFQGPLRDALEGGTLPVRRQEHQGLGAILAGARIDLRMRLERRER